MSSKAQIRIAHPSDYTVSTCDNDTISSPLLQYNPERNDQGARAGQSLSRLPGIRHGEEDVDRSVSSRNRSFKAKPGTKSKDRILDRNGNFCQSSGKWSIRPSTSNMKRFTIGWVFWEDWWHTMLNLPTPVLFLIIFACYTLAVILFAYLYLFLFKDRPSRDRHSPNYCGMDINSITEAIYFSLSTMSTIGYGVSDYYFDECWSPFVVVLMQVLTAITFDAVAAGLMFQRMSRGNKRRRSIVFSNKAVIRRVKGRLQFMFQIAELRKYHLVEAHVRVYCVRHERRKVDDDDDVVVFCEEGENGIIETVYFKTSQMKLSNPDDTMGSFILMALPSVVVHEIDEMSPLMPDKVWYDANSNEFRRDDHKLKGRHNDAFEQMHIETFMMDRETEIIVLVEGTDELTGSTLQARHSYRWDDVCWNHTFAPCVSRNNSSHQRGVLPNMQHKDFCAIDFAKFHDLVPVKTNTD